VVSFGRRVIEAAAATPAIAVTPKSE